jgi:hypothetical protein
VLEICFEGGQKVNNELKKNVVYGSSMTQLGKRAPPLISQQVRGIIIAERSQDSL